MGRWIFSDYQALELNYGRLRRRYEPFGRAGVGADEVLAASTLNRADWPCPDGARDAGGATAGRARASGNCGAIQDDGDDSSGLDWVLVFSDSPACIHAG